MGPLSQLFKQCILDIHWVNLYLLNSAIGFPSTYLLDSDLSGGINANIQCLINQARLMTK